MKFSVKAAGVVLLLVQCGIALSVAAKFALDRATRPRVWVRARQFDPEGPLRGRYLAMQVLVDGCSLVGSGVKPVYSWDRMSQPASGPHWNDWMVTLDAVNAQLVAHAVEKPSADAVQQVRMMSGEDCHASRLNSPLNYYVAEHADSSLLRAREGALWVEVTVPSSGPPRPIQLAVSDSTGWHVLKL